MTPLSEKHAKVIASLAHACGLGWGTHWYCIICVPKWSRRYLSPWPPEPWRNISEIRSCEACGATLGRGPVQHSSTTLEEWQNDWQARCSELNIDPGGGPSTSWESVDGRVSWQTYSYMDVVTASIMVGSLWADCHFRADGTSVVVGVIVCEVGKPEDLAEMSRIVTAITRGA